LEGRRVAIKTQLPWQERVFDRRSPPVSTAGAVTVALPPGQGTVEAVIPDLNFEAAGALMVQITPVTVPPFVGRAFYGTADTKIEYSCTPVAGSTSCTG
jgi:hypothetical protein